MERQYLLLSPVGNSQHFEVNIFLIVQFITWFRIKPIRFRRKALDNIDLNQMSHRYVRGVLQDELTKCSDRGGRVTLLFST